MSRRKPNNNPIGPKNLPKAGTPVYIVSTNEPSPFTDRYKQQKVTELIGRTMYVSYCRKKIGVFVETSKERSVQNGRWNQGLPLIPWANCEFKTSRA